MIGSMEIGPAPLQVETGSRRRTQLFALTIFLSACLLFEIQPIIAKIILPWCGGGAVVWTTSMLFFQLMLLLGYVYAHGVVSRLRGPMQAGVHIGIIAITLLLLRTLRDIPKPASGSPSLQILEMLTVMIGLPYFVLSATTPLLQAWYARHGYGVLPYRFFALSNLGSVLALVCYPVLIEPFFGLRSQVSVWLGLYVVFAVLCTAMALKSCKPRVNSNIKDAESVDAAVATSDLMLWVLLPVCSSALLLSVTNHLCQEVAPIPFLWVLPLCLYLLTFVFAFDKVGWYRRRIWMSLLPVGVLSMVYLYARNAWDAGTDLLIFPAGLFVCCMFCHGELARLKPAPQRLTLFYTLMSLGGAIGGLAVSLGAPNWFVGYSELPLALAVCCGLAFACIYGDSVLTDTFWMILLVGLIVFCIFELRSPLYGGRVAVRNFYGVLRVREAHTDKGVIRRLYHGKVLHGAQFQSAELRRNLTTYYSPASGLGIAMEQWRRAAQRVGIVGLGAGTIAGYARTGDIYRFYEINPQIIEIARREFTYLKDSLGSVDVVLGDARLSLNQDPSKFDVLVVDAFSGDAIPMHLLTREAMQIYLRHLSADGVMAFHISNRYFDLAPEVASLAASIGWQARLIESEGREDAEIFHSAWVLVAKRDSFSVRPGLAGTVKEIAGSARCWSDDYSNLLSVLRW